MGLGADLAYDFCHPRYGGKVPGMLECIHDKMNQVEADFEYFGCKGW